MAPAPVTTRPIDAQAQAYAALNIELEGIKNKRFLDDKHFGFDAGGYLVLHERPLDWLSQIWEFIVRLFTNKLPSLEGKITQISTQVEHYLMHEQDEIRLNEFLGKFTPAINELHRCAARMQGANLISRQVVQHLLAQRITQEIVIVPMSDTESVEHRGQTYHPYKPTGRIVLDNTNSWGQIQFEFDNPTGNTWQTSDEFNRNIGTHSYAEHSVHSRFDNINDVNQVRARISYTQYLYNSSLGRGHILNTIETSGNSPGGITSRILSKKELQADNFSTTFKVVNSGDFALECSFK